MDISFIVVNYKSFQYLNSCLNSILNKVEGFNFEVIIVNNDEIKIDNFKNIKENHLERIMFDYDSAEKIKNIKSNKKIKIIEINKNIGFGSANNIGASISAGKYICFINPDTEIYSNNIKNLILEFKSDPSIGIIGPKIIQDSELKKEEIVQEWSVGVDLDIIELFRSKMGISRSRNFWKSKKKVEVDWITGASMFIKKTTFLRVGGFDEEFFLYYEDLDLCKKVRKLGEKIIYYPDFKIIHLGGKSNNNKYSQKIEYFKSQDYYYKKWFTKKSYFLLRFLRFFYIWRYKN